MCAAFRSVSMARFARVVLFEMPGSRCASTATGPARPLVVVSSTNAVSTLLMNNPAKLNGWTKPMLESLREGFATAAADSTCKVVVLTGADPYYCAGVNLADTIRPMHPRVLRDFIVTMNQRLFDLFLDFPKPIIIAANGPAIGACVTSATLCDAIVASERATFSTPFAALGVPPEGCSSVHFERIMGAQAAARMLGPEGWKPTAAEAHAAGWVTAVVPHEQLMPTAQALGERWAREGKARVPRPDLKAVNARESLELGNAFLGAPFLTRQANFLSSKGKWQLALAFRAAVATRPLWGRLLD